MDCAISAEKTEPQYALQHRLLRAVITQPAIPCEALQTTLIEQLSTQQYQTLSHTMQSTKQTKRALYDLQFISLPEQTYPWGNIALLLNPSALFERSSTPDLTPSAVFYYRDGSTAQDIERIVLTLKQEGIEKLKQSSLFATLSGTQSLRYQQIDAAAPWYLLEISPDSDNTYTLLSWLFNTLVITGKPLSHYGCNFYIPLDLFTDSEMPDGCRALSDICLKPGMKSYVYNANQAKNTDEDENIPADLQSALYFSAHLRRYLFETGRTVEKRYRIEPLREYHLKEESDIYLAVGTDEITSSTTTPIWNARYPLSQIHAQVEKIRLYRYFNQLFILDIQVSNDQHIEKLKSKFNNPSWLKNDDNWWHDLLFGSQTQFQAAQYQQTEVWLRYTSTARRLYPTFVEQKAEGKIDHINLVTQSGQPVIDPTGQSVRNGRKDISAKSVDLSQHIGNSIAPYVPYLLAQFFDYAPQKRWTKHIEKLSPACGYTRLHRSLQQRLNYTEDDRAFVSAHYTVCGPQPRCAIERANQQRLFSYMLYVDSSSTFTTTDGYNYDPEFTKALLKKDQYCRWNATGTYYGYTDYSNISMGYSSYFSINIARNNIPKIYNRMLLTALFYRLSLGHYNRRITYATNIFRQYRFDIKSWLSKINHFQLPSNPFSELRHDYIEFTNKYWFTELTEQAQGQEIFAHQMRALRVSKAYQEIKEEMQWAQDYITARTSKHITLLALIFSIIFGVVSGFGAYPVLKGFLSEKAETQEATEKLSRIIKSTNTKPEKGNHTLFTHTSSIIKTE